MNNVHFIYGQILTFVMITREKAEWKSNQKR